MLIAVVQQAVPGEATVRLDETEEDVLNLLARHFASGGDPEKTVRYNLLAGERDRKLFLNDSAAVHFEEAARAIERMPPAERSRLGDKQRAIHFKLGETCQLMGWTEKAHQSFRRIIEDPGSGVIRKPLTGADGGA